MEHKKRIYALFCCLFIISMLIACAGSENDINKSNVTQRKELILWTYYETENQQKSMDGLVAGFNSSQQEYEMRWEYHGPVTEFSKRIAIATTENQLPDMVIIDNPNMPSYIGMDMFEDITDEVKEFEGFDEYFPNALEAVKKEKRYYGLPFCCNNLALIYNKDIFNEEKVSVPKTLEELKTVAERLTQKDRYGFAMSAIGGEQGAFQFAPLMLSYGDDMADAGGIGTLEAYSLIEDMAKESIMPRECVNWSQNDVARAFIDGKCAMMENGPWVFPALDKSGISYGVAYFPEAERNIGLLGGEVIGVLKGKERKGSIEFMKYYSRKDNMLNANLYANSLPPREDVAKMLLKIKPEFRVIVSQMKTVISRTEYEGWSKLSELLSDGLYQVIVGKGEPEAICKRIKEGMQESDK